MSKAFPGSSCSSLRLRTPWRALLQEQAPAMQHFTQRGSTGVSAVDVDAQVQATFGPGAAAPAVLGSSGYATYYANYHSLHERPFCDARARAHFDWLLEIGAQDPRRVAGVPIPDRR